MDGDKKGLWFKFFVSVWVILTLVVDHIAEMEKPFVGDPERWHILYCIMLSIGGVVAVVAFVYTIYYGLKYDRWWSRK